MFRPVFSTAAVLLLWSASARGDSLGDTLGPREVAVGDSLRAEAVGSMSTVLNPAGLVLNSQLAFESYYGYRPQDKASVGAVSACDSTTPIAGCFYYHYVGASPELGGQESRRRLHEGGITAARAITPQFSIGTNTHFFDYNSDLEGEGNVRGYAFDVGAIFQPTPAVRLAGVGYNLIATDTPQYPRALATGLSVRPGQGNLGLSADALWNLDVEDGQGTGRYGGGAEYFLAGGQSGMGYPLRAGGVYDAGAEAGYVSFGLGLASAKFGLDIGGRKQISGAGDELILLAGLRLVGPTTSQR